MGKRKQNSQGTLIRVIFARKKIPSGVFVNLFTFRIFHGFRVCIPLLRTIVKSNKIRLLQRLWSYENKLDSEHSLSPCYRFSFTEIWLLQCGSMQWR